MKSDRVFRTDPARLRWGCQGAAARCRQPLVSRTALPTLRPSSPHDYARAMCGEAHASHLVLRTVLCDETTGGAKDELGPHQPGLVALVRSGKTLCRSRRPVAGRSCPPGSSDVVPRAHALMTAHADRVVWGTDGPHPTKKPSGGTPTDITPLLQIADGRPLHPRPMWAPDAAIRPTILVAHPARLSGLCAWAGPTAGPPYRLPCLVWHTHLWHTGQVSNQHGRG